MKSLCIAVLRGLFFVCVMSRLVVADTSGDDTNKVEIKEIAKEVWVHTSYHTFPNGVRYPSNGLIVREGDALTLIDTAWGEESTATLLQKIDSEIALPVTRTIVTHHHDDRVAGVALMQNAGIQVFAHPMTRLLVGKNGQPVPENSLDEIAIAGSSMKVGNLTVIYPGPAHAADNIMVWLDNEKILFGGCPIRAMDATTMGNTADGDLASWQVVIAMLSRKYAGAQIVVPGHGDIGDTELLSHTHTLLMSTMVN